MDETVEDVVEEEEVADKEDVAVVEEDAVADAVEEDEVTDEDAEDEDAEDEDAVPVSTPTGFLFQAPRGASWGLPPRFLLRRRCRPPRVLLPQLFWWRSLAPLVLPLGPLRLSLQSLASRVLLHVEFSPLSFVGSFFWGIVICYASVPGMLPTLFRIETLG